MRLVTHLCLFILLLLSSSESFAKAPARSYYQFGEDAAWKKLSAMPEYQHNVSKIHIYFLYPAAYSDF